MKASELINKIAEHINKHGDTQVNIGVIMADGIYGYTTIINTTSVNNSNTTEPTLFIVGNQLVNDYRALSHNGTKEQR